MAAFTRGSQFARQDVSNASAASIPVHVGAAFTNMPIQAAKAAKAGRVSASAGIKGAAAHTSAPGTSRPIRRAPLSPWLRRNGEAAH